MPPSQKSKSQRARDVQLHKMYKMAHVDASSTAEIQSEFPKYPGNAVVFAKFLSDNSMCQVNVELCNLLVSLSAMGNKIPVVCITRGGHGRLTGEIAPTHINDMSGMTLWGTARTARQEMPSIPIQLLDVQPSMSLVQIGSIVQPPPTAEWGEAAYYRGARWTPTVEMAPSMFRQDKTTAGAQASAGGGKAKDSAKPMFMRKKFSWGGPTSKLDYCWHRQSWHPQSPARGAEFDDPRDAD